MDTQGPAQGDGWLTVYFVLFSLNTRFQCDISTGKQLGLEPLGQNLVLRLKLGNLFDVHNGAGRASQVLNSQARTYCTRSLARVASINVRSHLCSALIAHMYSRHVFLPIIQVDMCQNFILLCDKAWMFVYFFGSKKL